MQIESSVLNNLQPLPQPDLKAKEINEEVDRILAKSNVEDLPEICNDSDEVNPDFFKVDDEEDDLLKSI